MPETATPPPVARPPKPRYEGLFQEPMYDPSIAPAADEDAGDENDFKTRF